uniref:Sortilin-related receptor n=1 Tax=Clastoptera arizonana TaxID=38151 RepID=A0A1B6DW73_9HEMI
MTEPGENTTTFTMFGSAKSHHQWLIIKVDLKNAFSYNCTSDDYKMWSPGSEKGPKMACVMGKKETYQRRVPHSNCYNGENYDRPIKLESCYCDAEDFECDFGFLRHVQLASVGIPQCIRNKTHNYNPYLIPNSCKPGLFYNRTKGYRKIEGDACEKGDEEMYLPDLLPCPYDERREFLLLAQRERIVRFDLKNPVLEVLPIGGKHNIITIDFDIHNNCVFWADIISDTINRQCLASGDRGPEILVERDLSSIEGMAYDWISNMLYFVDGLRKKIEVIRTDINYAGRLRKTVIGPNILKKPRGIAIHPMKGYLYWTDWAAGAPSVNRATMDGQNIKKLFEKPDVEWPNGITIDYIAERIYWVDAREDYVASADLHGRNFRKIIQNEDRVSHPFAVAVFKDNMYWDDWKRNSIFMADKDHGVGVETIASDLVGLMDLKVYAHSVQEGTNRCAPQNHACSHLCFPLPDHQITCACPDHMETVNGECLCPGHIKPNGNDTCPTMKNNCTSEQFKCGNDLCIPSQWRCDGDNDCGDNSDEMNCTNSTCQGGHFVCKDNSRCIPQQWVCDLDRDCLDGSDEQNCHYATCEKNQFTCKNGRCISARWRCDMEDDCRDGSDEDNCTSSSVPSTCTAGLFTCPSTQACIPISWKCDGEKDCADGYDEKDCSNNTCEEYQFLCKKNKRCIFNSWVCDGDYDCGEGDLSDEEMCTTLPPSSQPPSKPGPSTSDHCSEWMFECSNKRCIPLWWKCDGVDDCGDKSDENMCSPDTENSSGPRISPTTQPNSCRINQFQCLSGDCIDDAWVCDGSNDCEHGEDERNCNGKLTCDSQTQFKCRIDGSCIPKRQVCDNIVQCPDKSDEASCSPTVLPAIRPLDPSCQPGLFSCDNGRCIPLTLVCNNKTDCYDESDEKNCHDKTHIYQVLHLGVEEHSMNETSLRLFWWIQVPINVTLEYLPSYSILHSPDTKWFNASWTTEMEYQLVKLQPFTTYNITVYVRVQNGDTYPPAKFFTATTGVGVPEAPWNPTVKQLSASQVEVSWHPPHHSNGPIMQYIVCMSDPIPPACKSVDGSKTKVLFDSEFKPHKNYSFWVRAKNMMYESNSSDVKKLNYDNSAAVGELKGLSLIKQSNNNLTISWQPVVNAQGYYIITKTNDRYPLYPSYNTSEHEFTILNLAPGVSYDIEVGAFNKNFKGKSLKLTAITSGEELPIVPGLQVEVSKYQGTTVKLSWEHPKDPRKVNWKYGIYYGLNLTDLITGPKNITENMTATIKDLSACESYIFGVGLVGPYGLGPLSGNFQTKATYFNSKAPPKNFRVFTEPSNSSLMLITWSSSCPVMNDNVSYSISVKELNLNLQGSVTLAPTNKVDLQHHFETHVGGHYEVCLSTDEKDSLPGPCTEYWAQPLPTPHQLQILMEVNGSCILWWKEASMPENFKDIKYEYLVSISEGSAMNLSTAKQYHVMSPPFIFNDVQDDTIYSCVVQLVTLDGYKSLTSEIASVAVQKGIWPAMLMDKRSFISLVLPTFLVIITLAGALGYVIFRHRRLQNNFTTFTNSHYNTRSGSATFTGAEGLDEEDSPVIRGFSDDEPLVIA